ncbi:hypothetical protein BJ980_002908 [Nocardioides daedukensis]|uniref:Uncharacterized protein n=1 Tax=Nocardioides daedukensis TaxID=634462 RepID=A0A7Y9UW09_9ACTN|nr:hypothetical protein [Nocardioides daedukensis]NYG59985.1 hypothetical protein [Nocardioides daedukensis]
MLTLRLALRLVLRLALLRARLGDGSVLLRRRLARLLTELPALRGCRRTTRGARRSPRLLRLLLPLLRGPSLLLARHRTLLMTLLLSTLVRLVVVGVLARVGRTRLAVEVTKAQRIGRVDIRLRPEWRRLDLPAWAVASGIRGRSVRHWFPPRL